MGSPLAVAVPRRRTPDPQRRPARPSAPRRRPAPPQRRPSRPPMPGWRPARVPPRLPVRPPIIRPPTRFPLSPLLDIAGPLSNLPIAFQRPMPDGNTGSAVCANPRPEITGFVYSYASLCNATVLNFSASCLDGQAGPGSMLWLPTREAVMKVGRYRTASGLTRYQFVETRCFPNGVPYDANVPRGRGDPLPVAPSLARAGISRDAALGRGLPHGYDTGPVRAPGYTLGTAQGVSIEIRSDPSGRIRFETRPVVRPRPNPNPKPRDPRREKKHNAEQIAGVLQRLAGGFSEGRDFVESLWRALPASARRGTRSNDTWGQLRDLIEHWNEVDLDDALLNLLENEIEDRLIGRIHGQIGSTPYGRDLARRLEWLDSYVQGAHGREDMLSRYERED